MLSDSKYLLSEKTPQLDTEKLDRIVRHALVEDIGKGDITSQLTIPEHKQIEAVFIVKEDCLICGLPAAERAFTIVDQALDFGILVKEGQKVKNGKVIARCKGKPRVSWRLNVAVNLLSMLSGIATKTRNTLSISIEQG